MYHRLTFVAALLLCSPTVALALDRFAVLETFGRPHGTYCSAAGPALISLQHELDGEAVLLEYDFDVFTDGRVDRFWATGTSASFLPLVMVGSGYRTSSGPVDYENDYSGMIQDELARSPRAEVTAYWRRSANIVRSYVMVRNTRSSPLLVAEEAAVWVIVYEEAPIGVSNTWVRSTMRRRLFTDLAPGEIVAATIDVPSSSIADWDRMACVVLIEDRPGGNGRYDMLQAAEAAPASLTVEPAELVVTPTSPTAEILLEGPHVLEWTATVDVPWLEIEPASGTLPSTPVVRLKPELRRPWENSATVSIYADGDSMSFQAWVDVSFGARARRGEARSNPGRKSKCVSHMTPHSENSR